MGALALRDDDFLMPRDVFVTPQLFERRKEIILPRHSVTLHKPEDFAAMMPVADRDFEAWLEALEIGDERAVAWLHTYVRRRRAAQFSPYTDTYNSGSGNSTIPAGSSSVTSELWGSGGGGAKSDGATGYGGNSGAYSLLTRAILTGEWTTNLAYSVASGGVGYVATGAGNGTDGSATTMTGTLNGTGVSMSAGGGKAGTSTAAGTPAASASGGGTNTNGNVTISTSGASAPNGGTGGFGASASYDTEAGSWVTDMTAENGGLPGAGGGGGFYQAAVMSQPAFNLPAATGGNGRVKNAWS